MADEVLQGSCLCGAVRYRVRGPFMRFVHCHCSRCRKATGSGHATNLIAEAANLEWIAGQDQTQRFDLPSAKSFATAVWSHMWFACATAQPRRPARRHTRRIARFYPQCSTDCPHFLGVPDAVELRGG